MIRAVLWLLTMCLVLAPGCAWISDDDVAARWDVDGDGVARPYDCDDRDPDVTVRTWYADADGDGYGDPNTTAEGCSAPAGFVADASDCDDGDPAIHPGADERCNGLDDDCNSIVDDGAPMLPFWVDADGDGYGAIGSTPIEACAAPPGYADNDLDCDDDAGWVNPSAPEVCNEIDDNCNGYIDADDPALDPGDATWYPDTDGDGYGVGDVAEVTCDPLPDWVQLDGDCDDHDPTRSPGELEVCDGVDNNCDGLVDENSAIDAGTWYADLDADGYGDPLSGAPACYRPQGRVGNALDCDDTDHGVHPLALERCDGIDNNCNGLIDDEDQWVADPSTWYRDGDGDGFGTLVEQVIACDAPPGFAPNGLDCDDYDAARHPAADEVCDGVDNDCDGRIDDADTDLVASSTSTWFLDADGDGYGSSAAIGPITCVQPPGYVGDGGDCDDGDPTTYPGAPELCDGRDNDCDAIIDEDTPTVWYRDADGDGFGTPSDTIADCDQPDGYVLKSTDCDDGNAAVNPAAIEICNDIDDNCNGYIDEADPALVADTWYGDGDGDGHGDPTLSIVACDPPPGFVATADDCDDALAHVAPGLPEICDGFDNDCNGLVDDEDPGVTDPPTWYRDADLDGWGDDGISAAACYPPYGHVLQPGDCDDARADVNPGAPEVCDGVDNDCDDLIDDDDPDLDPSSATTWYADADGDGHGDPSAPWPEPTCVAPPGHVDDDGDCDDASPVVHPGHPELCDLIDNDCDDSIDEDTPTRWYADVDGDGWGDPDDMVLSCPAIDGRVLYAGDCDDEDASIHPGAAEICDGVDNSCNGLVDDDDPTLQAITWYVDADGDGFGNPHDPVVACELQPGFVADVGDDCNDANPQVFPGAEEVCNGIDDNCSGWIDDADPALVDALVWYPDRDGDGYGNVIGSREACAAPHGFVADPSDCVDDDYKINPGATERCNGLDDDCDGLVDDDDPALVDPPTWYLDDDGDHHGDPAVSVDACVPPSGPPFWVAVGDDCDDDDAYRYPEAPELCDGEDNDCDGSVDESSEAWLWYADADGDGYGDRDDAISSCALQAGRVLDRTDCDDANPAVNPGAKEICNGIDDNCSGLVDDEDPLIDASGSTTYYVDADDDGWGADAVSVLACSEPDGYAAIGGDCDDDAPAVNPGATEVPGNHVDENCDGAILCYVDADKDGYGDVSGATLVDAFDLLCLPEDGEGVTADDCDDSDPSVHPGAVEVAGNDVDEDCDGALLCYADADGDGYGDAAGATIGSTEASCSLTDGAALLDDDCDDSDPAIHPGAMELPGNEVDENCDGRVLCYADLDQDGYGDAGNLVLSSGLTCLTSDGRSLNDLDCLDTDPTVHPDATEICGDGVDNDCDGTLGGCEPLGNTSLSDVMDVRERLQGDDLAGWVLANAGDVDDDGYEDLLVGAPRFHGAGSRRGAAWLVRGPIVGTESLDLSTRFDGEGDQDEAGSAVAAAGDMNDDGRADIAIGASAARNAVGQSVGKAYVLYGPMTTSLNLGAANAVISGVGAGDLFGEALAGVGDITGDGRTDLAVGAPGAGAGGAVYLFSGGDMSSARADDLAFATLTGQASGDDAGHSVAAPGDLDGDGVPDLVIGAPNHDKSHQGNQQDTGAIYVILDPGSGTWSLAQADVRLVGQGRDERVGQAVAGAGDVNGDGLADFITGGTGRQGAIGTDGGAYLILGPAASSGGIENHADAVLIGVNGGQSRHAVNSAGDIDGDGFDDVAVGVPEDDTSGNDAGAVYLLYGPIVGTTSLADADAIYFGMATDQNAGTAVVGMDHDGDGFGDLAIGAGGTGGVGAVFMISGGADL